MTKEEIVYKIEQIAHNGAFDGINADYVEREAEKLAEQIVKLFAIPDVVRCNGCDSTNTKAIVGKVTYVCNDCDKIFPV
tara:strand:- start:32560 stop:32796 length:237 start_codon:yes stop_codon:yes gene_type:complete